MAATKGPRPVPNVIRLAAGMEPPRHAADLADVHPEVQIPPKPPFLSPEASAEWDRIAPELLSLRLVTALDLAPLAIYCSTWGRLVIVERALQRAQAEHVAAGADASEALLTKTPTGFRREDVLARMASDLCTACDRFLGSFGLSPSTRARVRASLNTGQAALPGFEQGPGRFFGG